MTPMDQNEPYLSSALARVGEVLSHVAAAGIPPERTALLGFSQGACLTTEYVARHARRYGAVAGLSGGLIGPAGTARAYPGRLDGTPVFLGCSDVDPHIPKARVAETGEVLQRLGAVVDLRLYPGMGHLVNEDELGAVRALFSRLLEEE
jgi:predicted esterase